jgi:hypothetical protein
MFVALLIALLAKQELTSNKTKAQWNGSNAGNLKCIGFVAGFFMELFEVLI